MIDRTELELHYTYHTPRSGQPEVYAEVRRTALDRLDEVVMRTNAAIARRG